MVYLKRTLFVSIIVFISIAPKSETTFIRTESVNLCKFFGLA